MKLYVHATVLDTDEMATASNFEDGSKVDLMVDDWCFFEFLHLILEFKFETR